MKKFICHNQFLFFYLNVWFQVNCSSSNFSSSSPKTTHYLCPQKDRFALLQFKSAISVGSEPHDYCDLNSSPKITSWTAGSDCCSWDGVTCNEDRSNVIGLDLDCSWLQGTIQDNSSLFHLSRLQWLNLAFNNFRGSQISPEFGRLTELTHLNLSCSEFDGLVPSKISRLSKLALLDLSSFDSGYLTINQQTFDLLVHNLTKLNVLKLEVMKMSSVKAFSLLNLSQSMTILDLRRTGIQGKFPEVIFRLPKLQELYLHHNRDLAGYLPKSNWSSDLRVLYLYTSNFKGQIPASIGNLRFLEDLSIGNCNFTGSIPASIGNLTRLTNLDLSFNHLTGELPPSISKLQKVTDIDLSRNMLTGQIFVNFSVSPSGSPQFPYHVNVLSQLTNLDLSENFLNGRVPSWLITLPSLDSIDISYNNLTGPIEQFNLGLADSLRVVYLQNNEIHGSIPSSMFELVNLTFLDISSNNLDGTVKFDMLSKLKNLEYLDLSNNSLLSFSSSACVNCSLPNLGYLSFSSCNVSEFPSFLRTSENLYELDLSNNKIHGGIAKSESEEGWKTLTTLYLSNNFLTYIEQHPWKNISTLDLRNNMLQGSILVPPPSTEVFLVSSNKLTGQIPPSICDLSSLSYLGLSNNSLSAKIPSCLGKLSARLIMLHLQRNKLQGSIPDTFVDGSSLTSLDLSDNKLEGPLPRSLVNSSQLEVINVGNNKIIDTFPCWLGMLPALKILVLRSNRFYGPLCDSKTISSFHNLRIIDLADNEFTGFLPRRIFASMGALMNADKHESGAQYMEGIYYHDSVNVTMKDGQYTLDRILTIFTSIDLSRNGFQGEIPEVLGKFKSLLVLNLSHNSLTGNIPLSLTNLTALESLDLSSNKLDGQIPAQFESLSFLSVLKVSYNNLSGLIPQGNHFSTYQIDYFIGNKGLRGDPLSLKCGDDGAAQASSSSVSEEEDETAGGFYWKIVMMGYASGLVIGLSIGYIVLTIGKPKRFVKMVEGKQKIKRFRSFSQRRRRTMT